MIICRTGPRGEVKTIHPGTLHLTLNVMKVCWCSQVEVWWREYQNRALLKKKIGTMIFATCRTKSCCLNDDEFSKWRKKRMKRQWNLLTQQDRIHHNLKQRWFPTSKKHLSWRICYVARRRISKDKGIFHDGFFISEGTISCSIKTASFWAIWRMLSAFFF